MNLRSDSLLSDIGSDIFSSQTGESKHFRSLIFVMNEPITYVMDILIIGKIMSYQIYSVQNP